MTTDPHWFWEGYCAASGETGALPDIDCFGDTPALADELLALVMIGQKRATCELVENLGADNIPSPGDHWIITDGAGEPKCIIRTSKVDILPVNQVDEKFAWDEGEGDRSLAYWKREHDAYFERTAKRAGYVYTDTMPAACERFIVVWPLKFADNTGDGNSD